MRDRPGTGGSADVRSRRMDGVTAVLQDLSDQAWVRLRARLDGLTDEEYLWEPAPGCWSIREGADGRWAEESVLPGPDPAPFTTLAWRLWHLIDMYGEERAPRWLQVPPQGPPIGLDDPEGSAPPTAAEAIALLERAHDRWDAHLALATDESLAELVGPVGGQYADRSRANYVLHMLDEFIHHGAEVALLRDLWRWQHPVADDDRTERAIRGDLTLLDEVSGLDGEAASALMGVAASYGRWDLVTGLVEAGVAMPTDGRTPLHLAAGAGALDVVQLLVEHGADVDATDPEFRATPLGWAQFLGQQRVVDWLGSRPSS